MKVSQTIALNVLLLAAVMAGAQAQSTPSLAPQPNVAQSTTQPNAMGAKAQKTQAKEVKRQAKYTKKAAQNRLDATKHQEKAAKTRAEANKQQGQADVDRAKAINNEQKATPQP